LAHQTFGEKLNELLGPAEARRFARSQNHRADVQHTSATLSATKLDGLKPSSLRATCLRGCSVDRHPSFAK
jgi:hypothetical protein